MFRHLNFKSFIKFLSRNKLYTFINILGLSLSLMFVILIATYVVGELSTDKYQEKADRIYLLGNENFFGTAYGLPTYLLNRYPEIEKLCAMAGFDQTPIKLNENNRFSADILFVDTTFLDLFSYKLIDGDRSQVLIPQNAALLTESYARVLFGDKNPIGQTIYINADDESTVVVTGIIQDIENSLIKNPDIIMRMEKFVRVNASVDNKQLNNASGVQLFILSKEGTDITAKTDDMAEYFSTFFWIYSRKIRQEVVLLPLKECYFFDMNDYTGTLTHGNWFFVVILIVVGCTILAFAVINYTNLTLAQTGFRAKEMATRQLLGASEREVFLKFIIESILICFVSAVIGLLSAAALQDYASTLLQKEISILNVFTLHNILIFVAFAVILGVVSGIAPASIIVRYKPIDIVKGSFRQKTKMLFSKIFIVLQNIISISLVTGSLFLLFQIKYLINYPIGYNNKDIIVVDGMMFNNDQEQKAFCDALKQIPSVKSVGLSRGTPFNGGNNNTTVYRDKNISFQILEGDTAFFKMMDFTILRNNGVSSPNGVWLNQQALYAMELTEDVEAVRPLEGSGQKQDFLVCGIVKDFIRYNANYGEVPPFLIFARDEIDNPWHITVQVTGDPYSAYNDVAMAFKSLTGLDFTGQFIEDELRESYSEQQRVATIVVLFTIIALLISALGLLAMSTYFIRQRSLEIAVRKVFGSTNREALGTIISKYMLLVLVAFVIAVPVCWYVMSEMVLTKLPTHIALSPLFFIAGGLFTALIALLTVLWQSTKAANANPVDSIVS